MKGNRSSRFGGSIYSAAQNSSLLLRENVVIQGNSADYGGGIYLSDTQIDALDSVQIRGNAAKRGGGFYYNITQAGGKNSFEGTISGNTAEENGGGYFIMDGGTFYFTNAEIRDNTAQQGSGSGGYIVSIETVQAVNTAITDNRASVEGGGIYIKEIRNNGYYSMTGGTVSGNTASGNGGGIFCPEQTGTLSISGEAVISGNTKGTDANNVYLPSGKVINVSSDFSGDRSIGITMQTPGVFTNLSVIQRDENSFFSDDPAYIVGTNGLYLVYLGTPRTVSLVLDKNGTTAGDPNPAEVVGMAPQSPRSPRSGTFRTAMAWTAGTQTVPIRRNGTS